MRFQMISARLSFLALLFTTIAAFTAAAPAQAADAVDPADNAALAYWRAWTLLTPEFQAKIPTDIGDAGFRPNNEMRSHLFSEEADWIAHELLRAASRPYCDFAGAREDGPRLMLPHLAPSRRSVQFLAARARLLLDDGGAEAAARHIEAGYNLARHMSGDRVFISSLVALSNFDYIDRVAAYAHDADLLNPESRRIIAAALSQFDPDDPFEHRAAIRGERELQVQWLRTLNSETYPDALARLFGENSIRIPKIEKNFYAAVDALDLYHVAVEAAWFGEDSEKNLRELHGKAKQGAFGPITEEMAPHLDGMYRQFRTIRDERFPQALHRIGLD